MDGKDPLGDGDFVKWYRMEKSVEQYEKENPTNPLDNVWAKIKGPLSSIAILLGGFYAIPLINGIKQGLASNNVAEGLGEAVSGATELLDLPGAAAP